MKESATEGRPLVRSGEDRSILLATPKFITLSEDPSLVSSNAYQIGEMFRIVGRDEVEVVRDGRKEKKIKIRLERIS